MLLFYWFWCVDGVVIDLLFGLEMKLIGEVMGIDCDFGSVFVKS